MNAEAIPAELRERPQWVVWKAERIGGKWTKVPYRVADGGRTKADTTDPRTWGTFERALAVSPANVKGVGYVFAGDDPYTGIDLDGCMDAQTAELHPAAADVLAELDSYRERSPSGCGLHAYVRAELHGDRHKTKETPWGGAFEIYDRARFFTVTGDGAGVIAECQDAVDRLYSRFFPAQSNGATPSGGHTGPDRDPAELIAAYPELGRIARREGHAPKDASASGWDFYLACTAVRCGATDGEIAALIRLGRPGDPKAQRANYLAQTIGNARKRVGADADPAARISARWNLGDDPIVSGETLGDVASGAAKVYLYRASGQRLRFPRLADLFDPAKHTRIASQVTRSEFEQLTGKQATAVAQAVIKLCGGQDADPLTEAREWVSEFVTHAGAVLDGNGQQWDTLSDLAAVETRLEGARTAAGRTAILRDGSELWLPAGALKDHSGARMSWPDFTAALHEVGWRHERADVREPSGREAREQGQAGHICRNFYVGKD